MTDSGNRRPIIIVRKSSGHGHGHHGGSWKVAYADFVTAMMAFFLVMWIMGMDSNAKELIQGYFQNPVGYKKGYGGGANPMSSGNSPQNLNIKTIIMETREQQRSRFSAVVRQIRRRLEDMPGLEDLKGHIDFVITDEGLRIELLENGPDDVFFASGSATLRPAARAAFTIIGQELARLPNHVVLEGHTDARPYGSPGYSNWELSGDRANAARRALLGAGLQEPRILEVRGYADRKLRVPEDPLSSANRRVSILLPFEDLQLHDSPVTAKLRPPTVPQAPAVPASGRASE